MGNVLKNKIIVIVFFIVYSSFFSIGFTFGLVNNILSQYDFVLFGIYSGLYIYILYILKKNDYIVFKLVIIKIMMFTLFLIVYFSIEQLLIALSIYSIGDSGGWIRENIYEDIDYQFQWYEVLFWNFTYSLHYPVYIYIFFKPFVNYLDNSIGQLKGKQIQNDSLSSFMKITLSCIFAIVVVVNQSYLLGNPGVNVYIAVFVQLFEVYLAIHFYRFFYK